MKKLIFWTFLFFIKVSSFSQNQFDLMPSLHNGELVYHTYYVLSYSETNEQAFWVFYRLTPEFFNSELERTEDFREDPSVSTGSATLEDYKNSGYDRGHLCPAADMKLNDTSISESFFLSNMSPQNASFNRGIWSKLESLVRDWCLIQDTLYIATGPIFRDNLGTIGSDSVTIPGYFYKAILDGSKRKMIAFVLPNAKSSADLQTFVITVDSLEILTGIDFFPAFPNDQENKLESKSDFSIWDQKDSTTDVDFKNLDKIYFYPNPTKGIIHLNDIKYQVKIANLLGESFYTNNSLKTNIIDLSDLPNGIYLLELKNGNSVIIKKIIKE